MWRSAAKCGATFVAVITAVLGIVLFNRPANAWLLALALLFCCIADFVIERDFRFGVISFGLAHLVLIGYIAQLGGFRWGTVETANGNVPAIAVMNESTSGYSTIGSNIEPSECRYCRKISAMMP